MFMTAPGFIVLLLLGLLLLWLYVQIAKYPGEKARERGHPQADAINVLGWVGPFVGLVGWVVALVWAYTTPVTQLAEISGAAERSALSTGAEEGSAEEPE